MNHPMTPERLREAVQKVAKTHPLPHDRLALCVGLMVLCLSSLGYGAEMELIEEVTKEK